MRKIKDSKVISIPEVKDILEKLATNIGKENFDSFQESTLEFCNVFSKVEVNKADKIRKMLKNDYKLEDEIAVIVINILPNTIEELRVIFEKDLILSKLSDDDLQEMVYKVQDLTK
ncbi:MAG: hypothetical protein GY870_12885 [archaeon]|nr:hypothetical protein [archaeon]